MSCCCCLNVLLKKFLTLFSEHITDFSIVHFERLAKRNVQFFANLGTFCFILCIYFDEYMDPGGHLLGIHTDKKENQIILMYKEIQAVAKSYMGKYLRISSYTVLGSPSSYMTLQLLHSEFPYI
jgi:hypothetical protein